ncbi:DUF927 domain-containing protein [bacterium]|nr:DUF927 domain-containing protein [bacterium]MBY0510201.1 DUF927 domain-containing protein [Rhodospirillaceae bacterium]
MTKPGKFKLRDDGVWHHVTGEEPTFIAPYIRKKASLISRRNWQTLFEFRDEEGKVQFVTPLRSEARSVKTIRELLINRGYKWPTIKSPQEGYLVEYLRPEPKHRISLVEKTGWDQGDTFVFPDAAIGPRAANVKYRSLSTASHSSEVKGDHAKWRSAINKIVPYSSSAMLALGTAFGAPFHQLLRIESGGFNLFGSAGKGKTSECVAAQSVFSKSGREHVLTWDITETGLDELRCERSDMLVYLDDMGRAGNSDARKIEKITDAAFRLTTGSARRRSQAFSVDPEAPSAWVALLSTSVRSMIEISLAAGSHVFGGEEVRLIDVPALASQKLGIFESCPPSFANTRAAIYQLESVCAENYGVAGRAYISKIVEDKERAAKYVRKMVDHFVEASGASGSSETRYVQRFGLAYAGLKLASRYNVIRLPEKAAWKAIRLCYRNARASAPTYPETLDKAFGRLRASLLRLDGLLDLRKPGQKTTNCQFKNSKGVALIHETHGEYFAVKLDALTTLSDSALSARQIVDCLKDKGLLISVKGGKSTIPVTIPGIGKSDRQRLVCIKHLALKREPAANKYAD